MTHKDHVVKKILRVKGPSGGQASWAMHGIGLLPCMIQAFLRQCWKYLSSFSYAHLRLLNGKVGKCYLLHFERNYFTGVNRLTPQTELLHTSKNEVKVIPSLPARSWKSSISTRCFTPRWDWLLPTSRSGVKEITNSHASAFGNFEKVIMMLSIMAWGTFQLNIFNNYSVKHIYFTYSAHYHCHE